VMNDEAVARRHWACEARTATLSRIALKDLSRLCHFAPSFGGLRKPRRD